MTQRPWENVGEGLELKEDEEISNTSDKCTLVGNCMSKKHYLDQ